MNWLITIPQKNKWEDYQKELDAVADGSQSMFYKMPFRPKEMQRGDRCYIVWKGYIRGWMEIKSVKRIMQPWVCTTTQTMWPPGWYMERSGPFHPLEPMERMKGFRGVRKYKEREEASDSQGTPSREISPIT